MATEEEILQKNKRVVTVSIIFFGVVAIVSVIVYGSYSMMNKSYIPVQEEEFVKSELSDADLEARRSNLPKKDLSTIDVKAKSATDEVHRDSEFLEATSSLVQHDTTVPTEFETNEKGSPVDVQDDDSNTTTQTSASSSTTTVSTSENTLETDHSYDPFASATIREVRLKGEVRDDTGMIQRDSLGFNDDSAQTIQHDGETQIQRELSGVVTFIDAQYDRFIVDEKVGSPDENWTISFDDTTKFYIDGARITFEQLEVFDEVTISGEGYSSSHEIHADIVRIVGTYEIEVIFGG